MLELLRIRNFALIDAIEVEFDPGLNVLTGETGAGKSIIVEALNLVLGARASAEVVRAGAARAEVDAVFRLNNMSLRLQKLLEEHDLELENGLLVLSRSIMPDGRSRAYISGRPVTLSVLSTFGDELVDFHGQHDHQSLLRAELQLDLLDSFAHAEANAQTVREGVETLRDLERKIAELEVRDREKERRVEFLKYELNEITAAGLVVGEEEELQARRNLITNIEKVVTLSSQAYGALYEGQGTTAVDQIHVAEKALRELTSFDNAFTEIVNELESIRENLGEIARRLQRFTAGVEFDPAELNALNERLDLLNNLKRKYGSTIEEILDYALATEREIRSFEQRDEVLAELQQSRDTHLQKTLEQAKLLSQKRRDAAGKLDHAVSESLKTLGMSHGTFKTLFADVELSCRGLEKIEFMFCANPGEDLKPLRAVASGGEISRVMLAIKSVLAKADAVPTLVFDEIDAGVGGAVANKVAAKLVDLAKTHQVLCITHLPAIAAVGHKHFLVSKGVEKDRTSTFLTRVVGADRVREIARLLDGTGSSLSLKHAQELLDSSGRAAEMSGEISLEVNESPSRKRGTRRFGGQ